MYLEYFNLAEYPFMLTPNTYYFCNLPHYQAALNVLLLSIRSGEGFIKIVGDVGTGKTMLCRSLLNNLGNEFVTAYISNPALDCTSLKKTLIQELGVNFPEHIDNHGLLNLLNNRLLELYNEGKKVIVIIDEAHLLSNENMEALRLLSNLETETTKLLQLVLFGQPELDQRLQQTNLRQLAQRITFSYKLRPITRNEIKIYIAHRLAKAGNKNKALFSSKACDLLFRASKGIPRLVNILCHKALMATFGAGKQIVSKKAMRSAIKDTESIIKTSKNQSIKTLNVVVVLLLTILAVEIYLLVRIH